jgi:hypothetical protein
MSTTDVITLLVTTHLLDMTVLPWYKFILPISICSLVNLRYGLFCSCLLTLVKFKNYTFYTVKIILQCNSTRRAAAPALASNFNVQIHLYIYIKWDKGNKNILRRTQNTKSIIYLLYTKSTIQRYKIETPH